MLEILCVFEGIVSQGCNTLGRSKYTRDGRAGVVIVESKYIKVRVVIIKSKYTKIKVVILRVEL